MADRVLPSGMTPAQTQGILRRLDGAKTLPDKAVLAQVGMLVAPQCPAHPTGRLSCHGCLSARGGRRLTDAKRAQLRAASRRPAPAPGSPARPAPRPAAVRRPSPS